MAPFCRQQLFQYLQHSAALMVAFHYSHTDAAQSMLHFDLLLEQDLSPTEGSGLDAARAAEAAKAQIIQEVRCSLPAVRIAVTHSSMNARCVAQVPSRQACLFVSCSSCMTPEWPMQSLEFACLLLQRWMCALGLSLLDLMVLQALCLHAAAAPNIRTRAQNASLGMHVS